MWLLIGVVIPVDLAFVEELCDVGTVEEVQHFQDACVGVDVVVGEFLTDGLDCWAEITPPLVGRCTFDLVEEEKTTLGVEGIVVDLDFGLEVESKVENLEDLGMDRVRRGAISSLANGLQ